MPKSESVKKQSSSFEQLIDFLFGVGTFLWLKNKLKGSPELMSSQSSRKIVARVDAHLIVEKLTQLGYFKYVSDAEIDDVKKIIEDRLAQSGFLDPDFEDFFIPKDRRLYDVDPEELSEGRASNEVAWMKEVLEKNGVIITNIYDDNRPGEENLYLVINDKRYEIPSYGVFGGKHWVLGFYKIKEILNQLLEEAQSKERFFGEYGGEGNNAWLCLFTQAFS